ncbi:stage III sporulation protein AF [Hominifimenecus sp. rT4P-3]|uniref:stage III sporulation protein AF n=1 Tax=Hominifimenecus sp. rT4P-3 TaxID=3242979 RepID=UPI003DA381CA
MADILRWVKNLAVYLIFSELLFQILPHKRYRKYLRFFSGLILVLLILSPLLSAGGLEQRLLEAIDSFGGIQPAGEVEAALSQVEAAREQGISGEYEAILQSKVEEIVKEEGYQIASFAADINLDPEAEEFGQIDSLTAVLVRKEGERDEIWIEPVVIGEEQRRNDNALSDLAEKLGKELGMKPEEIHLSLRG